MSAGACSQVRVPILSEIKLKLSVRGSSPSLMALSAIIERFAPRQYPWQRVKMVSKPLEVCPCLQRVEVKVLGIAYKVP